MQAELTVRCGQCLESLGMVNMDTADLPEDLQYRLHVVIWRHRKDCPCYRENRQIIIVK